MVKECWRGDGKEEGVFDWKRFVYSLMAYRWIQGDINMDNSSIQHNIIENNSLEEKSKHKHVYSTFLELYLASSSSFKVIK